MPVGLGESDIGLPAGEEFIQSFPSFQLQMTQRYLHEKSFGQFEMHVRMRAGRIE
jgi:hypothetical protein